jgi:hypothetical protein
MEPIRFTPFVERGYHAIRFEGRIGLATIFGTEWVTNMASPRGNRIDGLPKFLGNWRSDRRAA